MFKSVESALGWAGDVRATVIIESPSTNRMCWKPGRVTTNDVLLGLSMEECHLQADNIYSMVIGLDDPVCVEYLRAKYFGDPEVSRIVSRVHMSLSDRSIDYTILILAHLGVRIGRREITFKMIRDSLCCGASKVEVYRAMIYDIMDKIHYRALAEMHREMIAAGLIEDRSAGAVNY